MRVLQMRRLSAFLFFCFGSLSFFWSYEANGCTEALTVFGSFEN
jgi:hypothetical protein